MTARTPTALDLHKRRATCSSCPATVVWAITANGKRMLVNAEPSPTGNVLLELQPEDDGEQLVAHVLRRNQIPGARHAGQRLHTSHFTDCPRAAHHRRTRR